ncbi:hypothetical protein [Pseudomaricurvus sp. HS19]|uniref:hypothetical protein n=1 Tax=Pseudomaricurvus sp. HS19 TaxID=2692626 RepID=UPI00136E82C4|nr:hypothetical protein [Pseudomaricurvus sp. HS19]MYM63937.1 hypothetical protein [Pseudomaricurvus sp. HS19]
MTSGKESSYQAEWMLLQNQYDSYEKFSLLIKLTNVVVTAYLLFALQVDFWAALVAATLWLQDGIWKTWQSRINARLLEVEAVLSSEYPDTAAPMQYNQRWLQLRPGMMGMVKEYLRNALAPTVAYPHMVLVVLSGLVGVCGV